MAAHSDTHAHFDRWARTYDRSPLSPWFHGLHRRLLDGVPDAARVLDVGCGTGEALAALRARSAARRLVGIDAARTMLEAARAKGLDVVQADAHHLPFRASSFDVAVSSAAFHHFDDPDAAAREMRRVLAPGGEARIADLSVPQWLMRAIEGLVHGLPFGGRRAHRDWQVRVALRGAGFTGIETRRIGHVARLTIGRA